MDFTIGRVVKEGEVVWDGVRNFQVNNYMKEMKKGDLCVYLSIRLRTSKYSELGTSETPNIALVDLELSGMHKELKRPLKAEQNLNNSQCFIQIRLSGSIWREDEWKCILNLAWLMDSSVVLQ